MKNELNLEKGIDYYISEMNRKRNEMIERDGVKPIKGVQKFIKDIYSKGNKLAVASSSPKHEIIRNLHELDLIQYFSCLVSGEEVENSKPHPDVFLKTAELLNIEPSKCIVFEDTKNGSLAAKAAGMYCIGFENPDYPKQDLSATDLIIDKFDGFSLDN